MSGALLAPASAGDFGNLLQIPGPKAVGLKGHWHKTFTPCLVVSTCITQGWNRGSGRTLKYYRVQASRSRTVSEAKSVADQVAHLNPGGQQHVVKSSAQGVTTYVTRGVVAAGDTSNYLRVTQRWRTRVVDVTVGAVGVGSPVPKPPTLAEWESIIRSLVLPSGGRIPVSS